MSAAASSVAGNRPTAVTSRSLAGGEGATVVAARHHLPPPTGGYVFTRHLRSTLSHDTFAAQRRAEGDGAVLDLVIVRIYALDYLKRHEQRRNMVEREVMVGQAAHHRHVAEGLGAFASKTDLYTVERYYSGGELFESVESYYRSVAATADMAGGGAPATALGGDYGGLPLSIVRRIFEELMLAVQYLHDVMGLAHRNLKLENILLDEANRVRLSGLGMCAVIAPHDKEEARDGEGRLRLCCGSKHYVAPELLDGLPYDGAAVDVWAAGVVLYALVCGAFPFDVANAEGGDEAIFDLVRDAERVLEQQAAFQQLPDPQVQDLLRGIFKANPKVRLSVEEILAHPFLHKGH